MIHCECGRRFPDHLRQPILCVCGRQPKARTGLIDFKAARRKICNACEHRTEDDCCSLLPDGKNHIEGRRGLPNIRARCPDRRWSGVFTKGKVGFIAVAYQPIGGTEVWHQTLLPRLDGVAGFVCLEPKLAGGNMAKLGCITGTGVRAAQHLADCVDVLVVWGIGKRLGEVVDRSQPKVISVSHCDSRSEWTREVMRSQAPWTDHCVHICPSGRDTCPADLPATLIPNSPDPSRTKATLPSNVVRNDLGIGPGDTMLLSLSRLSPEKQIAKLIRAVQLLPESYKLVVAGSSSGWSADHAKELIAIAGPRVIFTGEVVEPGNLLAAADLFVQASEYEGYGLSAAEAILAGVPVISTPVGLLEDKPELATTVPLDASEIQWASQMHVTSCHPKAADPSQLQSVACFAERWQTLIDSLAG